MCFAIFMIFWLNLLHFHNLLQEPGSMALDVFRTLSLSSLIDFQWMALRVKVEKQKVQFLLKISFYLQECLPRMFISTQSFGHSFISKLSLSIIVQRSFSFINTKLCQCNQVRIGALYDRCNVFLPLINICPWQPSLLYTSGYSNMGVLGGPPSHPLTYTDTPLAI